MDGCREEHTMDTPPFAGEGGTALPRKEGILFLLSAVVGATILAACTTMPLPGFGDAEQRAWERDTREWRERRETRLKEPYGWLSLVGLKELEPGVTRVGRDEGMDLVVPAGPAHWGNIMFEHDTVRFETAPGVSVRVNGHLVETAALEYGGEDGPTLVEADTVQFHLIERGGRPWVRVRDSQTPTRIDFTGLERFPIDPHWRIEAEFVPHPPGQTIDIADVLGDIGAEPNPGQVRFERAGRIHSMEAVQADSGELWFIFADRTSGRETYGPGRFLYADAPVDNRVVLDFNRAYNPPCVFTEYSTCPLPPQSNRLDLRVTAGELDYRK